MFTLRIGCIIMQLIDDFTPTPISSMHIFAIFFFFKCTFTFKGLASRSRSLHTMQINANNISYGNTISTYAIEYSTQPRLYSTGLPI